LLNRVAVFIANYNMGDRADALAEFIDRKTAWNTDIFLIDNASDLVPPAVHTNVWIRPNNKQTTAAWLAGLKEAKRCKHDYLAYVFAITSADFPDTTGDPITPLAELLLADDNAVGVHPALTADSTTSWTHLITRGGTEPRRTWFVDNIFSMYRASWFDSIGWFDPELRYAWGIDLETCWHARQQGRGLYVHEGVQIRKVTNIAYRMERMRMSADERSALAGQNMRIILERKYGPDFWRIMTEQFVEAGWR
jgi:hypothetical protein